MNEAARGRVTCLLFILRLATKIQDVLRSPGVEIIQEAKFDVRSLGQHAAILGKSLAPAREIINCKRRHFYPNPKPPKDVEKLFQELDRIYDSSQKDVIGFLISEKSRIKGLAPGIRRQIVRWRGTKMSRIEAECGKALEKAGKRVTEIQNAVQRIAVAADHALIGRRSRIGVFIGSATESLGIAKKVKRELSKKSGGLLLTPTLWTATFPPGRTFLESVQAQSRQNDFAVFVFAPDDATISRGKAYRVARDNVLFEFGVFVGRIGPTHALILKDKNVKLPSDLSGLSAVVIKNKADLRAPCHEIRSAILRCLEEDTQLGN